ncbi:MAG: hypothetical protein Q9172_000156 [Xanthocarpia lactea]
MGSNVVAGGGAVSVTYAVEICPLNSGKGLKLDVTGRVVADGEDEATEGEDEEKGEATEEATEDGDDEKDEEAEEDEEDEADEEDEDRDGDGLIDEAPSIQVPTSMLKNMLDPKSILCESSDGMIKELLR